MNGKNGVLYIVATPIGNLKDITLRAVEVLQSVDLILAEDTRHASHLLRHHGVTTRTTSFHEHNEQAQLEGLLERLHAGEQLAVISDAGTPLISDPGFRLVRRARQEGIAVSPIPGASALVAALSAAGLATDRFCFEGFLPSKPAARRKRLQKLGSETRTLVFYESSHRVAAALADMEQAFGAARRITVAREISKKFETFYHGGLADVIRQIDTDENNRKGEFVLMVDGAEEEGIDSLRARELMSLLLDEIPLKKASRIAATLTGGSAREMYQLGLELDPGKE